jgi:hypothetical protein
LFGWVLNEASLSQAGSIDLRSIKPDDAKQAIRSMEIFYVLVFLMSLWATWAGWVQTPTSSPVARDWSAVAVTYDGSIAYAAVTRRKFVQDQQLRQHVDICVRINSVEVDGTYHE